MHISFRVRVYVKYTIYTLVIYIYITRRRDGLLKYNIKASYDPILPLNFTTWVRVVVDN